MRYLVMCRSLTYAQRAARLLERKGISSGIIKAPTMLSTNGCSYALSLSPKNGTRAVALLREENRQFGKCFLQREDGSFEEVLL